MCTSLKKLACNKPLRLLHSSVVIIFLPAELQMERSVQKVSKEALSFSQISTLKNLNTQRASWDSLVIVVVLITVMLLFSEAGYFLKEWVTLIYTPRFWRSLGVGLPAESALLRCWETPGTVLLLCTRHCSVLWRPLPHVDWGWHPKKPGFNVQIFYRVGLCAFFPNYFWHRNLTWRYPLGYPRFLCISVTHH